MPVDPILPFTLTGVGVVAGWAVAVIAFFWRRSGTETKATVLADAVVERLGSAQDEIKSLRNMGADIRRDLHTEVETLTGAMRVMFDTDRKSMEDMRRDAIAANTAFSASISLVRDQFSERATYNAVTFATKADLNAAEQRFTTGQDQIMNSLRRVENRLDEVLKTRPH